MRQVKLVKMVRDQQGQFIPTVPLMVYPTVSKFGQGEERFQWQLLAVVNGQIVKLCYLTDNQLLDFAQKIIDTVKEKQIALSLMGEQFVEQRINQLYTQKQQQAQMPAPQPVNQPVQYQQPQPVQYPQPVQQPQPQPVMSQPVNQPVNTTVSQPVNPQPVKPNTANIPDIDTV